MENQSKETIIGSIKGEISYKKYNRQACLDGLQLDPFKKITRKFKNNQTSLTNLRQRAIIAYHLHEGQIGKELGKSIESTIGNQNEKDSRFPDLFTLQEWVNPNNWDAHSLSREELQERADMLIKVIESAIEIARQKG